MDLDELERLLREATAGPCFQDAPYAVQKTMHAIDEDEFKLFCALRNSAPELIRDARLWQEHCRQLQRTAEFGLYDEAIAQEGKGCA